MGLRGRPTSHQSRQKGQVKGSDSKLQANLQLHSRHPLFSCRLLESSSNEFQDPKHRERRASDSSREQKVESTGSSEGHDEAQRRRVPGEPNESWRAEVLCSLPSCVAFLQYVSGGIKESTAHHHHHYHHHHQQSQWLFLPALVSAVS